ncbi:helix-turn-helix domain-containing protein [Nonomuraea jiangxiensis]|uniref:helix-turn-helix domain-containing protein n=1 Tax=Nonomuraea jiangxiensis TaxID=633440 RepID=UPI0015A3FFCE|nr:helix-turn-helix domain-containing protein [Nonomuraea jiangxiensis]
MQLIMSTHELPPADRFDGWLETMSRLVAPVSFSTDDRADFHGRIETLDLGTVQVSSHDIGSCDASRTTRLIRQSDPEVFYLLCNQGRRIGLTQDGKHVVLGHSDMAIYHTSHPFHVRTGGGRALLVAFPGSLLPFPRRAVEQNVARVMPGLHGVGALAASFLSGLAADRTSYSTADLVRLGITLTDLVTMLLGHHLDAGLPSDTGQRALMLRIHAYIQQNLGDRQLSPSSIAAAHSISVRTLHRLFALENATVARWIRGQRLERCRRDLVKPTAEHKPIHAIAARWGFSDAAVFTRAFHAAYGMSPQEYRAQFLPAPVGSLAGHGEEA